MFNISRKIKEINQYDFIDTGYCNSFLAKNASFVSDFILGAKQTLICHQVSAAHTPIGHDAYLETLYG